MTAFLLACVLAAQTAVWLPIIAKPPAQTWVYECGYNAYNCSDFGTQAEAQAAFDYCVALGAGDIHRLDSDGDSVACEQR